MSREYRLSHPCLGGTIDVSAAVLDVGVSVLITGGRSHVGAVSCAAPGRAVETIQLPGHRDGVVSASWASALAIRLESPVSVTCGIHYDGIDRAGIDTVLKVCSALLEQLMAAMSKSNR